MSTCSYCKEPIKPGAQICPNCRSDFLPAWNSLRRRDYERNWGNSGGGSTGGTGIAEVVVIGFFLWLYWSAAVWVWNTAPVQWVVNGLVSIWNWF